MKNSSISINGVSYKGGNISIIGNKVIIDGKDQTPDSKEIKIEVNGDIEELSVDYASEISIKGNVDNVRTSSGDVTINGVVKNNIQTSSGDVEIDGDVTGGINTSSGDVKCGKVSGNVRTMSGDIKHR